jgi:hypothetical protein
MDKSKIASQMLKASAKPASKQEQIPTAPIVEEIDPRNNGLEAMKAAVAPMMQAQEQAAPQAVLTVGDQQLSDPQDIASWVMSNPEVMAIIEGGSNEESIPSDMM